MNSLSLAADGLISFPPALSEFIRALAWGGMPLAVFVDELVAALVHGGVGAVAAPAVEPEVVAPLLGTPALAEYQAFRTEERSIEPMSVAKSPHPRERVPPPHLRSLNGEPP